MKWLRGAVALATVLGAAPALAQVDPSGTWRTWTSEHFRVHARRELEPWAVHVVREAERAYALLAAELRPPRGRVDVALFDNVDFSNGFTTFFPTNRITLFLPAPAANLSLGMYDDWLRLVTTHELVHVFHLDRADGVWGILRRVFGRNPALFPNAYQPSWVTEGLATYYESRFTGAGRVRGGFHDQLLAALAPAARWPEPNAATFGTTVWPAGFRPYAWGSRFFEYAARNDGDSVIPAFIDRTSRQLWPIAVSSPLRSAGTLGVSEHWARLRDRSAPAAPSPQGRVLVRGLRTPPRPRLSPAGDRFAYTHSDGRSPPTVSVYDLKRRAVVARHRATGDVELGWVGDTVYVTQLDFVSPVQILSDLYRWVPPRDWQRLTTGARIQFPFALGDRGVGAVRGGAGSRAPVAVRDGAITRLAAPAAADWGHIAVSPDGRLLAGARHDGGRWDIVVWPADGAAPPRRVTNDAALDEDPSWSADGTRLVFTSERDGLPQIHAWDIHTGVVNRLTTEPTGARDPSLTADGAVLYTVMLPDGHAIAMLEPVQPAPARVTRPPADSFVPAPDVPVVVGRYNPWPALAPRYWAPFLHDEGAPGHFFGVATSARDVIGRVGYSAFASVAPATGRWEGGLAVRYARWRAFALDVGADQTWEFAGFVSPTPGQVVPVGLRERFGRAGVTWRWRRWRTSVAVRGGGEWEQDAFFGVGTTPIGLSFRNPHFLGAVASVSVAHATRQAFSVSSEDGVSASVLYRRRWELGGPGWSDEWRGTLIGYLAVPLPGFARWVVAARLRGAVSGGPLPTVFEIGGESSDRLALVPGLELGGSRRTFSLRGYPSNTQRFTRAVTGALELRIPLVLVGRAVGPLPLGVDRVGLTAYVESGGGWSAGDPVRLARYRDVGAEVLWDLFVGFDVPLRVRSGAAVALSDGLGVTRGDLRGYVSVGASF